MKRDLLLFLFLHIKYVLDICYNRISSKYPKHMLKHLIQYSCIISDCHLLREGSVSQIIITNVVVVSSVGIKRIDCT